MAAGKAVFLRGTAGGFLRLVHADAVTVCHTVVLSPADTDAESGMDWDVVRHVKTGKVADVVTGGDCETLAKGVGRGAIPGMGVCRS
jgi:hypothetical protein